MEVIRPSDDEGMERPPKENGGNQSAVEMSYLSSAKETRSGEMIPSCRTLTKTLYKG